MSDEILKVTTTTEAKSRLRQWGRGLFYRDDGRKRTLVSHRVLLGTGISFGCVAGLLLVQNTPEPAPNTSARPAFAPPSDVGGSATITIPELRSRDETSPAPQIDGSGTTSDPSRSTRSKFRGPQVVARPRAVKIPPGAMVKAVLVSGASNGPVRAEIVETLSFGGETLVPQGTLLLGSGQSGENRLMIQFTQMVFQDGAVETVDAQGCDASDKIPGLKGSQVGSQALKLGMGIGLNFVGGMSAALQDTQGENGAVITKPTLKNAMLNGAATAALEQSREIMSDMKNRPPVYEIPATTPLFIIFKKD
ncbi:TrbI/VirB10 family protein [Bdellovibrionota bacterium FG-1]